MKILIKIKVIVSKYGILNFLKGVVKKNYFRYLRKRYKFDKWHVAPIELRIYAMELVKHVNEISRKEGWTKVIEIGCGIGEILRKIDVQYKIGYDISDTAINAARFLDRTKNIQYIIGSFNDVRNEQLHCLISVNFIHEISGEILKDLYSNLLTNNDIKYLIVDSVGNSYKYQHNFDTILPANYKMNKSFGPYQGERYLLLYKRNDV